jgi:predicted nuclease of predicted toxin-antitoxin system
MRFLVDECTGPAVARWLRGQQHEVFSVFDEARGMSDSDILAKGLAENWVIVTNDKDFGDLVFKEGRRHGGVIFLRLDDSRAASKIAALQRLLERHGDDLVDQYTVVRGNLIRIVPQG